MDKSTIIYLIAIGLFILSKALTKKKKKQTEEQTEGSPFDTIFGGEQQTATTRRSDPFDEIFESFGNGQPKPEITQVEPTASARRGYYTEEADSEEEQFPSYKAPLLDTPSAAAFTPIDTIEASYHSPSKFSVENKINYDESLAAFATFETETKEREEQEMYAISPFLEDFDLKKAIVYAEILKPKYQEI